MTPSFAAFSVAAHAIYKWFPDEKRTLPTAILSRQVAVIRGQALLINLPGQPKAIAETLQGLPQATPPVPGIFAAVPYCIDLIGGPYLETDASICKAFRPKSAVRPRAA